MRLWPFRSAPVETKSATLAEPDAELFELFSGIAPGSLAISAGTALTVPAVSAAVRAISEAAGQPRRLLRRAPRGERAVADDEHPGSTYFFTARSTIGCPASNLSATSLPRR